MSIGEGEIMRSTPRRFLAAILLTAAAGFALSQEAGAPPPPPVPDGAAPVAGLPRLPVVSAPPVLNPNAPGVDPAVTIDPSVLSVAPAAGAVAQVPATENPFVTTSTRRATKSLTKPFAKSAVDANEAFEPVTVENLDPPDATANTAPVQSDIPAMVAAKSAIPETPAGSGSRSSLILGEWLLVGVLLVVLFTITQMVRRRPNLGRNGLIDLKALELKPRPMATRLYRS
jgi:hypothetical protein